MYERRELAWMYRAYRTGAAQGRWFVNTELPGTSHIGPLSREECSVSELVLLRVWNLKCAT